MTSRTIKIVVSMLAIVVGVVILAYPNIIAYVMAAFLIIKGLFDLVNIQRE